MEAQPQQTAAPQSYLTAEERELLQKVGAWNTWMQGWLQQARQYQAMRDKELNEAYKAMAGNKFLPGVSYGTEQNKGLTIFMMGDLGTHKTTWCAGMPGPYFISVAAEGGDDALISYPKLAIRLLEQSHRANQLNPPPVFNVLRPPARLVHTVDEFEKALDWVVANYQRAGISTVIIDSLTYLVDMMIAEMTVHKRADRDLRNKIAIGDLKAELMTQQSWGIVNNWLRDSRVKLQNKGLNVIYTSVAEMKYEPDPKNQAKRNLVEITSMISGRNKITLPGQCKLHIYAAKEFKADTIAHGRQQVQPVFWLAPDPTLPMLRHKYLDAFPQGKLVDPELGDDPTVRALWMVLRDVIQLGA